MSPPDSLEAHIIRAAVGFHPKPPVDLFDIASRVGVRWYRATSFPDGFTDFSQGSPVIYLNRAESGARMRFIFAHEIAHVMMRMPRVAATVDRHTYQSILTDEEIFADHVAGTLLLPDYWIDALKKVRHTLTGLERVARLADVSILQLITRMADAQVDIGLLHWLRGNDSWHVVDRPGAPPCLKGYVEPSLGGIKILDTLTTGESPISIYGRISNARVNIRGTALRRDQQVYQLIRPSEIVTKLRPVAAGRNPAQSTARPSRSEAVRPYPDRRPYPDSLRYRPAY